MSKDAIIKILITIIALMVFIWLWHIISRMIIGTLILTTSLLSVLISLLIQIVVPAAIIVYAVKWITKVKNERCLVWDSLVTKSRLRCLRHLRRSVFL